MKIGTIVRRILSIIRGRRSLDRYFGPWSNLQIDGLALQRGLRDEWESAASG
jgi:hypothetical protein